jgi:hypothetical protein
MIRYPRQEPCMARARLLWARISVCTMLKSAVPAPATHTTIGMGIGLA